MPEGQLDGYKALKARALAGQSFVMARVERARPGFGHTLPNDYTEGYLGSLVLGDWIDADIWLDGRHFRRKAPQANSFGIFDLRRSWTTELLEPFRAVHFYLPVQLFDDLTEEMNVPAIASMTTPLDSVPHDETMLHFAMALLPALDRPSEVNQLFSDHIASAICIHLAKRYAGVRSIPDRFEGGLALWQERPAKEFFLAHIAGNPSLNDAALVCGMSPRHFARSFKASTGLPPHRWLLKQRVGLVKRLLELGDDALAVVALRCGFADQSHMTRVFRSATGMSPGSWRRMRHISNRRFLSDV